MKSGSYTGGVSLTIAGVEEEAVREVLENLAEMGRYSVSSSQPAAAEQEAAVETPMPETEPAEEPPTEVAPPVQPSEPAPVSQPARTPASKTVRISTDLLDTFINLVGELIVTKSRLLDLFGGSDSNVSDQILTRRRHVGVELEGVPADPGLNPTVGGRDRAFELLEADDAPRAHHVGHDVDAER